MSRFSSKFLEFAEILALTALASTKQLTVENIVDIWNTRNYRPIVIPPSQDDSKFTTLDQAIQKTLESGPIGPIDFHSVEGKAEWLKRYALSRDNPYYDVMTMTGDGWHEMERYEIDRLMKRVGEGNYSNEYEVQERWCKKCQDAGVKVEDLRWV